MADLVDSSYDDHFGGSEFIEGMKGVLDAVHPGLSSPLGRGVDRIPSHLISWHGGSSLKKAHQKIRRINSLPRPSSSSSSSSWNNGAASGRQ